MERAISRLSEITYKSELILDIKDVKDLIRTYNLCRSKLK